jgi:hypothetical protein
MKLSTATGAIVKVGFYMYPCFLEHTGELHIFILKRGFYRYLLDQTLPY